MAEQQDLYPEQRASILQIFATAEKADFLTPESNGIIDAFNKAATFVEKTPGIVEYTNWDRQSNKVRGLTDGTDFHTSLQEISQHSPSYTIRARALECLGNISTRHFDFVRSLYDLEKIGHVALLAPTSAVAGAAMMAFAKIATNRALRQTSPTVQHFQVYGNDAALTGGMVEFKSSMAPHYPLKTGGKAAYDMPSPITYIEAAVGIAAHIAGKSSLPESRRHAAETLRFIASERQEDRYTDYRDPRALVFTFVQALKATETDAVVLSTYEKILDTDPMLADKQRARSISDIADTLNPAAKKAAGGKGFAL